ncbi:DUF3570 domain-containing protein [Candidatus Endoriftia persephone]|uniref:DUF3570 domain-containing protein n=3 Tax=Gammaproteobacteria TaxID=1236 RepID=G2FER4_9GAMM|nr:DUF3570 domain-containing protein [Candidatus Endoriftia persephone]EGV50075.1 hypothetical protein Rifp1Sym_ef00020 [endosymbiont of Riftia pachyptila (vent Ph05)]EGW54646.1 hypothetical protein TevJSym_aj00110 [endosymbiont of Tevnia jerichonana (vent Tica)]USF88469.1 DUF3570 domain-containing protein [Candidatus Endoriftia persephone]
MAVIERILFGTTLTMSLPLLAAQLPEERADAMYHRYDGGGVTISGPSILARKQFGESISVSANYYVDAISSASIDVVTSASPYSEERTETSASIDYLHGNSLMNLGYTNSEESDYSADTFHFSISQEMFGDLTNVTLGYSRGSDQVRRNGDPGFSEDITRNSFTLGLSQVVSANTLFALTWETIADQGYLNNPYRSVRYLDPANPQGYSYEPEIYPNTRTSNALAARLRYHLPYRAALSGEYRFFTDTWGINAHNAELGYTQPIQDRWTFDLSYRYYTQSAADFYSDLFPLAQAQNYMARDKELSSFSSHSVGLGVSYKLLRDDWKLVDSATLNFSYNFLFFDYQDFRDLSQPGPVGEEPLYDFSANVLRLYLSIWY